MSINRIDVFTQGVAGQYVPQQAQAKTNSEEESKETISQNNKPQVSPDQVLGYMAANAQAVQQPKTINPAKYVDAESAARIAGFVAGFEAKVAEGLAAFDAEFPGANVSESVKMAVVLKNVDKES